MRAVEGMYASQTRARTVNIRIALANSQKGNLSIADYCSKIRQLADEMAAAGKSLDEEDIVSYILAGLDGDYNSIVNAMASRVEPVTVSELYNQLLSFEMRLDMLHGGAQSSVNSAVRGGRGGGPYRGGGRGGPAPQGRGNGSRGNYGGNSANSGHGSHYNNTHHGSNNYFGNTRNN